MKSVGRPAVTAIMPFRNVRPFLAEAIDSVLGQSMADLELIAIDDASMDGSDAIAARYSQDTRVRVVRNETPMGIVDNLNRAMRLATAPIIARMDGDDVCEPTRLERQLAFLEQHSDIAVVGSYVTVIDKDGRRLRLQTKPVAPEQTRQAVLRYPPFMHPATMFRRDAVLEVGGYRQRYLYCEDVDLWCRLLLAGYRGANIPEALLRYRVWHGSTAEHGRKVALKLFRLRLEMFRHHPDTLKLADVAYAVANLGLGVALAGQRKQALDWRIKTVLVRLQAQQEPVPSRGVVGR